MRAPKCFFPYVVSSTPAPATREDLFFFLENFLVFNNHKKSNKTLLMYYGWGLSPNSNPQTYQFIKPNPGVHST